MMWFLAKEPLNNYILLIINTTMINYLKFTLHTRYLPKPDYNHFYIFLLMNSQETTNIEKIPW